MLSEEEINKFYNLEKEAIIINNLCNSYKYYEEQKAIIDLKKEKLDKEVIELDREIEELKAMEYKLQDYIFMYDLK